MENLFMKHGMVSWVELMTGDVEAAKQFYTRLFGWELEKAQVEGPDYTIIKSNGRQIGGMMGPTPETEGVPPNWGLYVTVDDVDATARMAEELGAKICVPPRDIPKVGRFCVLQDPQGAFISAITYVTDLKC